jgi:DeoR family suf operon transcriptional repressor
MRGIVDWNGAPMTAASPPSQSRSARPTKGASMVVGGGLAAGGVANPAHSNGPQPLAEGGSGEAKPTREAVLALLLRQGEATAAELSEQLAVSVQVMRRHLRGLEDGGLVESSPTQEGPGRPSNRWRLTPAGHGHFQNGSEDFALGLLHSLAGSLPPEALRQLLDQQVLEKARAYRHQIGAGPLPQRLERLVELRRQEGYVAECLPDPDHGGAWLINEFHCSVMRIAEAFPIVCDQELQLIAHTFGDCRIERVHWRLEQGHSCGFRLTPMAPKPGAA